MSPVLENLVISIIASVITGVAVWLWNRTIRSRNLARKARFFGIRPGENCLLVMNHHPLKHNTMSHGDIETLVDAVKIVREVGGEVTVAAFDKILEPAGSIAEFCIGGPAANQRTEVHIKNYLKGIEIHPYTDDAESLCISAGDEKFRYQKGEKEFALLAKVFPNSKSHPVFLISGQTSMGNKAALYYLAQGYDGELRSKYDEQPFCLILELTSPWTYGYKSVKLTKDISRRVLVHAQP